MIWHHAQVLFSGIPSTDVCGLDFGFEGIMSILKKKEKIY